MNTTPIPEKQARTAYITAIGTAVPRNRISREAAARWMAQALELNAREQKMLGLLYEASGIAQRYTVVDDYLKEKQDFTFFPATAGLEPFPGTASRMELYRQHALPLSLQAVKDALKDRKGFEYGSITHLVQVSCTGMYAPGLDIELTMALGLPLHVQRTCIQFMGCYAAINALKTADMICRAEPEAKVLVVCTELCTLHFQKGKSRDDLVSNALFGDGAAAMLVEGSKAPGMNLQIGSFHCSLAPDHTADMAWKIGDNGFEMTLSSYVPQVIKNGIKSLAKKLLLQMATDMDEIDHFAIHPGGRRILEVCEEELGMSREDNKYAYQVLSEYGNMSSPTVIFVLKEIWKQLRKEDTGKQVLSFAFGPGLTMESMLLKTIYQPEKENRAAAKTKTAATPSIPDTPAHAAQISYGRSESPVL